MDLAKLFSIIITSIFIQNYVFGRVLGICPYMGVSKKVESSIGMGMAIIFVISIASAVTWLVYQYLLVPFHLEYLQTIMFILIIASLVQFVEMAIQKCLRICTMHLEFIFLLSQQTVLYWELQS